MKQNEGPAGPASRVPNLLGLLREDLRCTGSQDWTRPGFIAVAVYRIGVWADARPAPLRIPLAIGYAFDDRAVPHRMQIFALTQELDLNVVAPTVIL